MANTKKFEADKTWGTHWEYESIPFIQSSFDKVLNPKEKRLRFYTMNESSDVANLKKWDAKYEIIDTLTAEIKKTITFEIKADKYDSNNLFFEKTCSKKPSGVYATEADYFVYILPRYVCDNFYMIEPKKLIELLDENYKHCLQYGGDGGRVYGYVINKESFYADFKNAGGKILTWTVEIPQKFEVGKFTEKTKVIYTSNEMKKYPDPLGLF